MGNMDFDRCNEINESSKEFKINKKMYIIGADDLVPNIGKKWNAKIKFKHFFWIDWSIRCFYCFRRTRGMVSLNWFYRTFQPHAHITICVSSERSVLCHHVTKEKRVVTSRITSSSDFNRIECNSRYKNVNIDQLIGVCMCVCVYVSEIWKFERLMPPLSMSTTMMMLMMIFAAWIDSDKNRTYFWNWYDSRFTLASLGK